MTLLFEEEDSTQEPEIQRLKLCLLEQAFSTGVFPCPREDATRKEFEAAMEIRNLCEQLVIQSTLHPISQEEAMSFQEELRVLCKEQNYEPEVVENFFVLNSSWFGPYVRTYLSNSKQLAIH